PLGYFQVLCGLSRESAGASKNRTKASTASLSDTAATNSPMFLYVSDNEGEVRIGIHELLGRVVCAAATNPVELKQADTVFTRRRQPGPGVKFRFGECVSQGGRLLRLTEPGSGEGINDMHGHRAALRRNLVEIEATPGVRGRCRRSCHPGCRTRYSSTQDVRLGKARNIYRIVLIAAEQADRALPIVTDIKADVPQCRAATREHDNAPRQETGGILSPRQP